MHNEFVVELQDGSRDWVDPIDDDDIEVTESEIIVKGEYRYALSNVKAWVIRPYSEETTYDSIESKEGK